MALEKSFSSFRQFRKIDGQDMVNLVDLECVKSFINEDYENRLDEVRAEVTTWCSLYNFAKKNTEKKYNIRINTYILLEDISVYDLQYEEIFNANNAYAIQFSSIKKLNLKLISARKKKRYSILIGKDLIYTLCRELINKNNIKLEIIYSKLVELTGWGAPVKQFTSFYNRLIFTIAVNTFLYHEILHIMRFNQVGQRQMPEEREADSFASFLVTNFYATLLHPDNNIYSRLTSPETQFKHAAYLVLAGAMLAPHTLKILHGINPPSGGYDSSHARLWSYISEFFNFIKTNNLTTPEEAEKILVDCFCAFLCCSEHNAIKYIELIEKELNIDILIDKKE